MDSYSEFKSSITEMMDASALLASSLGLKSIMNCRRRVPISYTHYERLLLFPIIISELCKTTDLPILVSYDALS
jgi:hypothetical protein